MQPFQLTGVKQVGPSQWEFLVVSNDVAVYKALSRAIHALNGVVNYTSNATSAAGYMGRRKLDGIFLDVRLEGTLSLMREMRTGKSNRSIVVFACAPPEEDKRSILACGANFVLRSNALVGDLARCWDDACKQMESERRQYLRYFAMLPVVLKDQQAEQKALTANISRTGMAVHCRKGLAEGESVQFTLELPSGDPIRGRGEVAWSNPEGQMGIKFYMMGDETRRVLWNWMDRGVQNHLS